MTIDTKDMLNSILESISRISYIKPEEIPEIDLYMDQVTTFMDRGARSGTGARERSQGERGIPEPRSGEDMPRKPLDGVERHTCPRGKRPPVSLCPTASAGVGAEGAAPPTRDWFLGMPPGRPFFPKRAKRAGEPVPPPVGATPRARRVATRRAARPSVRSAFRRSTRLYEVKGSVLPFISKEAIV